VLLQLGLVFVMRTCRSFILRNEVYFKKLDLELYRQRVYLLLL